MQIFSVSFALFLLMDAIGNIPIYISVLRNISPHRHIKIIARELIIALVFILVFALLGDYLLFFLGISRASLLISGGVILLIIALKMIFPNAETEGTSVQKEEPFIVPLAVPLVAGPAVLAAVILYAGQLSRSILVASIVIAWSISAAILLASSFLKTILGNRGLIACERLMGLILVWIAIQMFLDGASNFFPFKRSNNHEIPHVEMHSGL